MHNKIAEVSEELAHNHLIFFWFFKSNEKNSLGNSDSFNLFPLKHFVITIDLFSEMTEYEEDNPWISELNFLKNSQAIVQPCSPAKPPSIRKVNISVCFAKCFQVHNFLFTIKKTKNKNNKIKLPIYVAV